MACNRRKSVVYLVSRAGPLAGGLRMGLFDQETIQEADSNFAQDDKVRLFETQQRKASSSKNYAKLLLLVALFVVVAGAIIYYLTLPGVGSQVLAPKGLEDEIRAHFLDKQKRTADDITFYKCDDFYWARVGVQTRTDIPGNPVYKLSRYRAKAVHRDDGSWDIVASPIADPEMDAPCSF